MLATVATVAVLAQVLSRGDGPRHSSHASAQLLRVQRFDFVDHFSIFILTGVKQSKFRHWLATVLHPSTHITNLPEQSRNISSACDGFHVNQKYAAIPLTTPGGPIAVIEVR